MDMVLKREYNRRANIHRLVDMHLQLRTTLPSVFLNVSLFCLFVFVDASVNRRPTIIILSPTPFAYSLCHRKDALHTSKVAVAIQSMDVWRVDTDEETVTAFFDSDPRY